MRDLFISALLLVLSGFAPVAALAQQTTPDANQPAQAQPGQAQPGQAQQQHPNQPQTQDFRSGQTQERSGSSSPAQTQTTEVEPPHTPQQSNQLREQERRSAEDMRINRNWTAEQEAAQGMKQADRMKQQQAEERMILERLWQHRMAEENQDHRGRTWGRDDDDMDGNPRYGSVDRSEGRYYDEPGPFPRVKTCIEYENGDEFCRYRN